MEAGERPKGGIYRPRNPRASALYQCVDRHAEELRAAGAIHRAVETQALERFVDCGDLHRGFARIRCDACGHDYLLAFSCKTRCFCPSCHQKRMLLHGEWVEEEILAPVPHRQYVFTVPKALRPHFRCDRALLGELCRWVATVLTRFYRAAAPEGRPAFVLYVQTFGDRVTFQPHVHALVADGVFLRCGTFRVLPALPEAALMQALREAVLNLLQERECITAEFAERLLAWRHSGFSVHNRVRVKAADGQGRKQLARYMIRAPFALGKMRYDAATGMVVYRSKMHATFKRNFQLVPGARWLELLLQHVPDKNEHLVRYYGYYSNRSRGDRARREAAAEHSCAPHSGSLAIVENRATTRAARASWARLIKQVYESEPLTCPVCGNEMHVIALIDDESVIRRILEHLGKYAPRPPGPGLPAGKANGPWPKGSQIPLTYHPLPDIA